MKLVINKCFGGFGLSKDAEELYLKKAGFESHRYIQTKYNYRDGEELYEKIDNDDNELTHVFTKDHGDSFSKFPEDDSYWYYGDLERNDPILIDVVEELGDKANNSYSALHVIEIPDGVEWEMDDYDGIETVHEKHRSW